MLARVLAMAGVRVRVCLSVTSRCFIEREERINLVFFARRLLSTSPTLCFKEIQASAKIWEFFVNSGLGKFRHSTSIVERAIKLGRERWTPRE